jgi:PII-like signaling protein
MQLERNSKLLRIFIGEMDKVGHQPLYEALLFSAKKQGIAGCSVIRGIMSYGVSTLVHTTKILDFSSDLPVIVEIVDKEEKINDFLPVVDDLIEKAGCGGLVTIEDAEVLRYVKRKIN